MDELIDLVVAAQATVPMVLLAVGCVWLVHLLNVSVGYRLCYLGIFPRSLFGLPGILFAPFLHGSFNHLFFNSIPLFVLANLVLLEGHYVFYGVTAAIVLCSGFATWCFGRKALHVGASGLIVGYWSYLMVAAIYGQTAVALVTGALSFYYFGALFFSIFPTDLRTSWEGHLFGFCSGILTYYLAHAPLLWGTALL
jgi:membrane associated rhomboid family serine protease